MPCVGSEFGYVSGCGVRLAGDQSNRGTGSEKYLLPSPSATSVHATFREYGTEPMNPTPHSEIQCDVARAFNSWLDVVAKQEEHNPAGQVGLVFKDTQLRLGWTEHQDCILPVIDKTADEIMEARNPAEAYLLIKSGLCQIALICFVLGRQHEGAEV